jgi:D-alanyl-D-alanine carboxypeptidase
MLRCLVLFVMIISYQTTETGAQPPAPGTTRAHLEKALRADLDAYLSERGTAEHLSALSLTVSLAKNQPPISIAAGTTRFPTGPAATTTDLYQIGSNTKAFTAVAILQLEAQGRVSIDAPIGTYLPQYPAHAKLTLRQLLSMTSGLESYDNTPKWNEQFS